MLKPRQTFWLLAGLALAAGLASAEVSRPSGGFTAATTNAWTLGASMTDRGILHKLEVFVGGSGKTCDVWIADSDGTLIASNTYASGSTFIATNLAVVGLVVKSQNANTNGIAVLIKPTLEK